MADKKINFRQTSGYVTDGAGETYCLAEVYPVTRGGQTFGWDVAVSTRDRSTGVDVRHAGINFNANSNERVFRIDLDASGDFDLTVAAGDVSNGNDNQYIRVYDGDPGTLIHTIGKANVPLGDFLDATGVIRTSSADWVSNHVKQSLTFSTTIARFVFGESPDSGNFSIAHIALEETTPAGPTVTVGGDFSGGATEASIKAGAQDLTLTLTNDTWAATAGDDNAITSAIIQGLDSAQSEAAGWNATIRDVIDHTAVVRTSATVLTITIPQTAGYQITANETITVTVPASALVTSGSDVAASPFDITVGTAEFNVAGFILNNGTIRSGETNLRADVLNRTTRALVQTVTGLSTDGSGDLNFQAASATPGTEYNLLFETSDGVVSTRRVTAE